MAGRAAQKVLEKALNAPVFCATVGCEQRARIGARLCEPCETRLHQERSEARCRELGLITVEDKRAYCARMARSIGRGGPGFEIWAKKITQKTVDIIVRGYTNSDQATLERLRFAGAIDEHNQVVPLEERAARAQAQREQREQLERELRQRGIVT